MASSIIELYVDVPADRQANIFGQFDEHLKLIERTLNVTMIFRDGSLKSWEARRELHRRRQSWRN